MKKALKKILTVFLMLCMLVASMPVTLFAREIEAHDTADASASAGTPENGPSS